MELFPTVQPPSSIDVDQNSFEESPCEPDPVASSNIVPTVTGAHMIFTTNPKGESLHKEQLSVCQAERDIHHCMKINAPLQHHHTSNSSVKPAATQDAGITNCTKHSTQDTTSKTVETAGVVQDTEPEQGRRKHLRVGQENGADAATLKAS